MVEVGTKIIGNFGAMIPLSFGEVVTIESFEVGPRDGLQNEKQNIIRPN